jgi:hypothetical protein
MALNTSGPISLGGSTTGQSIALELGLSATGQISLNEADVRELAKVASGAITMPGDFWGKASFSWPQQGVFAYGRNSASGTVLFTNISNLVSDTGVIGSNRTGVGSNKDISGAAEYGDGQGIMFAGYQVTPTGSITYVTINNVNRVTNTGVIGSDESTGAAPPGEGAACRYGGDKAIWAYGAATNQSDPAGGAVNTRVLVTNTGTIGSRGTGVGQARWGLGGVEYGGDAGTGLFAYGGFFRSGTHYNTSNLVSNTGVVAANVSSAGTARYGVAACRYGVDKAILGFGVTNDSTNRNITNLVSSTGVIASNTTGVGTARRNLSAAEFGNDRAIFAFGRTGDGVYVNANNSVSNTGIVSSDGAAVGTARYNTGGLSWGA